MVFTSLCFQRFVLLHLLASHCALSKGTPFHTLRLQKSHFMLCRAAACCGAQSMGRGAEHVGPTQLQAAHSLISKLYQASQPQQRDSDTYLHNSQACAVGLARPCKLIPANESLGFLISHFCCVCALPVSTFFACHTSSGSGSLLLMTHYFLCGNDQKNQGSTVSHSQNGKYLYGM